MAESGQFALDEEESDEEIEELDVLACTGGITVEQLRKRGDATLRAKKYQKAFAIYSIALNCPIASDLKLGEATVISEKLHRKRAECLFKMGKYLEAIEDCEEAIEIADQNKCRNLLAKSLFIKTTAIQNLGDYKNALPFAVWCKHLRPECVKTMATLSTIKEKLSQLLTNDFFVKKILITMVKFAHEMEMSRESPEVAVECYTEILKMLPFMFLPGVLLARARCLLKLGRPNDSKNDCASVLRFDSTNPEALKMMKQITGTIKKTKATVKETAQPREGLTNETKAVSHKDSAWGLSVETLRSSRGQRSQCIHTEETTASAETEVLRFDSTNPEALKMMKQITGTIKKTKATVKETAQPREGLSNETKAVSHKDSAWGLSVETFRSSRGQRSQCIHTEETTASAETEGTEEREKPDQPLVQGVAADESAELEKKRKRNKQKRMRKKEKKKERKEKNSASDQKLKSKTNTPSSNTKGATNKLLDDSASQASTVPQPQQSYPSGNEREPCLVPSSPTFSNSVLSEDPFADEFILVQNSRRKKAAKLSEVAHDTHVHHKASTKRAFPTTLQSLKIDQKSGMNLSAGERSSTSLHGLGGPHSSCTTSSVYPCARGMKDHDKQSFSPVTPSQRPLLSVQEQKIGVCQSREMKNPTQIPQGVVVVCKHFLQAYCIKPSSISLKNKTCKECENIGLLKYAAWNNTRHYWQEMRPYPGLKVPPRASLSTCKHFATHKPCLKEPCTFPHGVVESSLWTMEREGVLPTPQEVLASANANAGVTIAVNTSVSLRGVSSRSPAPPSVLNTLDGMQQRKPLNSRFTLSSMEEFPRLGTALPEGSPVVSTKHSSVSWRGLSSSSPTLSSTLYTSEWRNQRQALNSRFSVSSMEEFPRMGTALPEGSPVDSVKDTASPAWTKRTEEPSTQWARVNDFKDSNSSPLRSAQPKISEISSTPGLTSAEGKDVSFQKEDSISTQRFTADNLQSANSSSGRSTPIKPSFDVSFVSGMSLSNSGVSNSKISDELSSNIFRKIPDDVFVVCDDFLQKNLKLAKSIHEKRKACKGCENRSKLKYALWNNNSKMWQIIRPYPAEKVPMKVAFSQCRQYANNTPCLRTPCTFAHGQQELLMWTLERESVLPTPWETLTGLTEKTERKFIHTQPQLQYRPSPPGVKGGAFKLCRSCYTRERCRYGRGCIYAHCNGELLEWQLEYRKREGEKLRKELQDKEEAIFTEMTKAILKGPAEDLVEYLAGVEVTCSPPELNVKLQDCSGKAACQWVFNLSFQTKVVGYLRHVLLLHRYHSCYQLAEIRVGCYQEHQGCESYKTCYTAKLKESWYKAPDVKNLPGRAKVSLTVSFESSLYGSFDQCVVFDFGKKPYLVRRLDVDLQSESVPQTAIVLQHVPSSVFWDERSMNVVRFVHGTDEAQQAEHLSRIYSLPRQVKITENELHHVNYKTVMHQLLFVEEGFMKNELSSYTLSKTQLHAQWSIFDDMSGMKFAVDKELFGILYLQEEDALRPDDAAGRLLYRNVSSVWLQLADNASNKVYEAPVVKVESECVVLRLSSKMVSDLLLYDTCDVSVNAQFQLNRWPLCKMHDAIDRLTKGQFRLIFPEPTVPAPRSEVTIRWQWLLDKRLNDNQKKVIKQIASPGCNCPPLVVFGPFGTGKTFTLNQAVRLLVQLDKSHRILLCTHSNRAADIHVELLHDCLTKQNGPPAARPLRVYQPMRRLETTSKIARKYCLIKDDKFILPSRDDLVEHRVVITTLSTSQVLLDLQVLHGFFSHILIDEAAQALEPEALTPLIFAGPNTKVVFTGDHMQMSPEVYSPEARRLGLQKSLAERIFDMYDKHESEEVGESYVLFLTENYRCHQDILKFPSYNFYGEKLIARGGTSQPAHPTYGPLLFFSARGKEQKEHDNSYVNLSEVYEVVKRVKEVAQNWPTLWGPKKLSDIAVLSAYRYQVQAIRNSLRKEIDLKDVKVDTIHNVQGEEFRALFISTVRTFHTCKPQQDEVRASGSDRPLYWEFLSDPKLLNTAVTRARCLVAVVGDPVSLCTVGECRSIWRDYIKRCNEKNGLYGATMAELEKEINAAIDSIELNPKAEPFVPKSLSTPEQGVSTDVEEPENVRSNQEAAKGTQRNETDEEEGSEREPNISEERDATALEDSHNVNSCLSDTSIDQSRDIDQQVEERGEGDDGEGNVETGDLQDDFLEDETVSPRYLDEIILAFVRKCEETLQLDAARKSMFQDSEFPPLQASGSKQANTQTADKRRHFAVEGREDLKDLFPEIRVVNGRVEVRLTNLGFYNSPSERAQRIIASTKQQEFLDPFVLRQLLTNEPEKYKICNLRLNPEKSLVGYAEIEDTASPDIEIKGRVRQAFDRDTVVLELVEKRTHSKPDNGEPRFKGKVVGVLEHIISPHERQFVCTADFENPVLMVPINKSAPKLVNLSDKSCKDIPIYKKDQNNRATQIKMMERQKALSGKYLFVVKYLQWRRDCHCPLGIVVRTLFRGEDLRSSLEIAYAERGVRRAFKEDTKKYVKDKFPPQWSIPKQEYHDRVKIDKAFTIDPPTSLDLDDALTIERTSPTTFQVGIHIADVSFFVTPDSPLDNEAFLRCTSYYPGEGQENLPMLPTELSEGHCSLLPDQDRLAVSLFATLDEEGRLTEQPKIQRTIVTSRCRLSYAEAQMIIDQRETGSTHVPKEVVESVRQLSSLAQKRRRNRLGDRYFDHWQNEESGEYFEAHELVEEMMILANEEVAKLLSRKCSELAPLRVQLPPKDHRLAEWTEKYGKYARLSLYFSAIFKSSTSDEHSLALLHSEKTMFKIQKWVWDAICQAAESCDLPRLLHFICNERNHPQIATAQSYFRRIQSESRYVCEGDQPPENIQHYSLGMRSYTQFTSPIRRYIDIVVHRLLLSLKSSGCHVKSVSKDDIGKVCRRSTFLLDNARKFGKDCRKIRLAAKLQQQCHETRVFIESIEKQSISLHICDPEDDHMAGKQKRMLLSHMNPVALTEEEEKEDREKCLVLTWKIRRYVAPNGAREEDSDAHLLGYTAVNELLEVPSDMWIHVLDAVRANDISKLTSLIKQIETNLGVSSFRTKKKLAQVQSPHHHTRGHAPYRHPHYDEKSPLSCSDDVAHFYEKKLVLRRYDFLCIQLCPHMTRGILQPDIQMVKVNPYLNICIEHRKYPRESFAHTARHQASRERYQTIDEYIDAWKPVLAMEAATEAVKENDGFVIEHLCVNWEQEDETLIGSFTLPSTYCANRQLEFYSGDLVCVRIPCPDTESPYTEKQDQDQSSSGYFLNSQQKCNFWVGHFIINQTTVLKKDKNKIQATMKLNQNASSIPAELRNGCSQRCTLELIHRTLPQRRMYVALCIKLRNSSELVHAICKGEEPKKGNFGPLPSNLSLEQYAFKRLNQYQETAVKEALSKPFTLIQGPPGTGKTVTGVHIAYCFTEQNKRLKSYKVRTNDTGDNEVEGAYKAPPQVIYCGPSNKAVDVVTEYLMKIPSIKILRVYGDQIEQKEFPIPNKLKPARITRSEDELKMSSQRIRSVSLHHVIRSADCPYAEELRRFEEGFAEEKARGEIISQDDVTKYCKLIGKAERWALEESGVQIVLCTCATAGSLRINFSCDNIRQCIVDECGMCLEPESLVPITSSGAQQVVLIGDHKQLQPVIQDQVAKALGLSVSMFERHSKRAVMLQLQYRMHKGICEFPSKEFYDAKLLTAEVVNLRVPSPVSFWPAKIRRNRNLPIVFCHVEGQEESSVITTSESNEESKRNMKEVRKVVQVAKYLVNRYKPQVRMSDVVILSPYREQRSKISELLKGAYSDIHVTTITKSQGSEWDYVIISLVRSLKKEDIDPEPSLSWLGEHLGFLRDEHQMNVGITRARRGLCIIGNKNLLGVDEMWRKLIEHYEENHCVVDESWPWS